MDGHTTSDPRTVLLVEDDFNLSQGVVVYLRGRNIHVTPVETLAAAYELLSRHHFDAVLLDLNLGSEDGLALARDIGVRGAPALVIISGRATETDRITGLELGADDYLTKPFGFGELHARLRTVWRRTKGRPIPRRTHARFSGWLVDLDSHTARDSNGRAITLTAGEAALLRALLEHPGVALSRADLLRLTGHSDVDVFERVIDVLIARLRRKLETGLGRPALIDTIRGHGYRFDAVVTWDETTAREEPA